MNQPRSLAELMINDHERINKMFNDFKKEKNDFENAVRLFAEFSSELKKHIVVEDRITSSAMKKARGERENLLPIASSLNIEHERILAKLAEMSSFLKKNRVPDSDGFFLMLRHHKNIEERLFYPKLDDIMEEKEKNEAIRIIRNIKSRT